MFTPDSVERSCGFDANAAPNIPRLRPANVSMPAFSAGLALSQSVYLSRASLGSYHFLNDSFSASFSPVVLRPSVKGSFFSSSVPVAGASSFCTAGASAPAAGLKKGSPAGAGAGERKKTGSRRCALSQRLRHRFPMIPPNFYRGSRSLLLPGQDPDEDEDQEDDQDPDPQRYLLHGRRFFTSTTRVREDDLCLP